MLIFDKSFLGRNGSNVQRVSDTRDITARIAGMMSFSWRYRDGRCSWWSVAVNRFAAEKRDWTLTLSQS